MSAHFDSDDPTGNMEGDCCGKKSHPAGKYAEDGLHVVFAEQDGVAQVSRQYPAEQSAEEIRGSIEAYDKQSHQGGAYKSPEVGA